MAAICILTPDPSDAESFGSRWRDVLAVYVPLLEAAGLGVESRSWEQGGLAKFDLVLPLLAWGYHKAGPRWLARVAGWEREGVRLAVPPAVLRWNADKTYLARLAARGAPVVPTVFLDRISEAAMAEAAAAFGAERLVAKPQVSASAWRTIRWSPGEDISEGPDGPAMIQPYLDGIERGGEVSLIWLGGRFSHAVRKVPKAGDFRVQPEYRGVITRHAAAADELEAAEAALAAAGEDLPYARVDLVRGPDGRPALIELELIEPDLYLGYEAGTGERFAAAVAAAASRQD